MQSPMTVAIEPIPEWPNLLLELLEYLQNPALDDSTLIAAKPQYTNFMDDTVIQNTLDDILVVASDVGFLSDDGFPFTGTWNIAVSTFGRRSDSFGLEAEAVSRAVSRKIQKVRKQGLAPSISSVVSFTGPMLVTREGRFEYLSTFELRVAAKELSKQPE